MHNYPGLLLKVTVLDADDEALVQHREIEVQIEDGGIAIRPPGYGDKTSLDGQGSPLFIEFRNGIPFVVIWDDINNEEPSHVISLQDAAESNRCDNMQCCQSLRSPR